MLLFLTCRHFHHLFSLISPAQHSRTTTSLLICTAFYHLYNFLSPVQFFLTCIACTFLPVQFDSSLPSGQSGNRSQYEYPLMHWPLVQRNWSYEQASAVVKHKTTQGINPGCTLFIYSFICLFIYLFIHSFIYKQSFLSATYTKTSGKLNSKIVQCTLYNIKIRKGYWRNLW